MAAFLTSGVILNPGFSRVKDLAWIGTGLCSLVALPEAGVHADPREILHGLKAVQDDAERVCQWARCPAKTKTSQTH